MQRNLVSNGGMLDEVIWIIRTNIHSDVDYLEELIKTQPEYTRHFLSQEQRTYRNAYKMCQKGVMYIKIDDDVVRSSIDLLKSSCSRKLLLGVLGRSYNSLNRQAQVRTSRIRSRQCKRHKPAGACMGPLPPRCTTSLHARDEATTRL